MCPEENFSSLVPDVHWLVFEAKTQRHVRKSSEVVSKRVAKGFPNREVGVLRKNSSDEKSDSKKRPFAAMTSWFLHQSNV